MTKHHYVYKSYEEEGREYIGCRTCDCLPEEDIKYFGSFKDKSFKPTKKTILFVCETREEVAEIEIELHDFFDVAVNPQFANRAKAISTGFDRTGVPWTEEQKKAHSERMSGENHPRFGVPHTKETRKKQSVAKSGENNPQYGVPHTEEWKKSMSGENHPLFGVPRTEEEKKKISEALSGENNPQYGRTGALHHNSKAIIAIKPDGTELHFGSICEAARELKMNRGHLSGRYLKPGYVTTRGKWKGWQFLLENR